MVYNLWYRVVIAVLCRKICFSGVKFFFSKSALVQDQWAPGIYWFWKIFYWSWISEWRK